MSDSEKLIEFRKLLENCVAFREDIDFYEMKDVALTDDQSSEEYKLKFQLKTSEDKVQQMLFDEYRNNRHSILFDRMQEAILKTRNGNLIGGLLLMKVKQHDFDDMETIITKCMSFRAGREALEEIGMHNPRILRLVEKTIMQSNNFKLINFACYIDGINVNKLAHAVIKLNDLEKLQEFGEQHAEDLSLRTRRLLAHCHKNMSHEDTMTGERVMERVRTRHHSKK